MDIFRPLVGAFVRREKGPFGPTSVKGTSIVVTVNYP